MRRLKLKPGAPHLITSMTIPSYKKEWENRYILIKHADWYVKSNAYYYKILGATPAPCEIIGILRSNATYTMLYNVRKQMFYTHLSNHEFNISSYEEIYLLTADEVKLLMV